MTLVPYVLGMAGNGDDTGRAEGGRAGPEGAVWTPPRMALLRQLIDENIAAIAKDAPADVAEADKRSRAITNVARSIKAVDALVERSERTHSDVENPEDEMSDERDDDPKVVAELRAELVGRLDRLRAIVEQKSVDGRAELGAGAQGRPEAGAGSGCTPGGADDRLADLGDARRTGGGKDLRGGLLVA